MVKSIEQLQEEYFETIAVVPDETSVEQKTLQDVLKSFGFKKKAYVFKESKILFRFSVIDREKKKVYVLVEVASNKTETGTLWVEDENRFACAGIRTEYDLIKAMDFYKVQLEEIN